MFEFIGLFSSFSSDDNGKYIYYYYICTYPQLHDMLVEYHHPLLLAPTVFHSIGVPSDSAPQDSQAILQIKFK